MAASVIYKEFYFRLDILQVISIGTNMIALWGRESHTYLAMNDKGKIYGAVWVLCFKYHFNNTKLLSWPSKFLLNLVGHTTLMYMVKKELLIFVLIGWRIIHFRHKN